MIEFENINNCLICNSILIVGYDQSYKYCWNDICRKNQIPSYVKGEPSSFYISKFNDYSKSNFSNFNFYLVFLNKKIKINVENNKTIFINTYNDEEILITDYIHLNENVIDQFNKYLKLKEFF
jgi:hypothetical protein